MKILLKNGGDANLRSKSGLTPLHLAAMNRGIHGPKLTRMLLEFGGNPNLTENVMKWTPLHWAIDNKNDQNRLEITKQLLEKDGNPNAKDMEGGTPVHYVVKDNRSNSLNVLKLLLAHGGNILQKNSEGITPHIMATQKGSKQYCLPEVKKLIVKTYRKMK
jgi:ankyrin repeat protein